MASGGSSQVRDGTASIRRLSSQSKKGISALRYRRAVLSLSALLPRSKDGQREMQVIPGVENQYAMLGSTPTCNDLVAQLHSALPGPARDGPL